MKKFSEIADSVRGISEVKEPTGELKKACWKGYTAVGMKMKNGRKVPNCVPVKEDIEQLDEMPGANMDTRAVHTHLKKKGWKLSRTAGSHDVFTHPEAEHHIAVPRHKQLKAPLVKGILKQSEIKEERNETLDPKSHQYKVTMKHAKNPTVQQRMAAHDIRPGIKGYRDRVDLLKDLERTGRIKKEEVEQIDEISQETKKSYVQKAKAEVKELKPHAKGEYGDIAKNIIARRKRGIKMASEQVHLSGANKGRFVSGNPKVPFKGATIVSPENKNKNPMERVKALAKAAARRQAGISEDMEPEDSQEKTNTPAKRSLTKTAGMVKDLANKAKEKNKKEKPEAFQPEPELSSQIIKV